MLIICMVNAMLHLNLNSSPFSPMQGPFTNESKNKKKLFVCGKTRRSVSLLLAPENLRREGSIQRRMPRCRYIQYVLEINRVRKAPQSFQKIEGRANQMIFGSLDPQIMWHFYNNNKKIYTYIRVMQLM